MMTRTLVAVIGCGAALFANITCGYNLAHADTDPICQQSQSFGLGPGQIAENMHSGNPTAPLFRLRGRVLNTIGGCPQP
jgi:hypothetical protein